MTLRHGLVAIHLLLSLIAARPAQAQETDEALRRTVMELDEAVFTAFNQRDLDRFMTFFSEDLEFYHDADGLSGYAQMVENSRRLFGQDSPLRRELVDGATEVHAVPGYGAIQIGRHEFCHLENGRQDCGVFGFTHVWRERDGRWQITRVLSYGHRDPQPSGHLSEQIRGSGFPGCYALVPGPWDDGIVLYGELARPRVLELDSVPQRMGLGAGYRASLGQDVDRLFADVSWHPWAGAGDRIYVSARAGLFTGYQMSLVTQGDSIEGVGSEFSDNLPMDGREYRSHGIRGVRVDCTSIAGT